MARARYTMFWPVCLLTKWKNYYNGCNNYVYFLHTTPSKQAWLYGHCVFISLLSKHWGGRKLRFCGVAYKSWIPIKKGIHDHCIGALCLTDVVCVENAQLFCVYFPNLSITIGLHLSAIGSINGWQIGGIWMHAILAHQHRPRWNTIIRPAKIM